MTARGVGEETLPQATVTRRGYRTWFCALIDIPSAELSPLCRRLLLCRLQDAPRSRSICLTLSHCQLHCSAIASLVNEKHRLSTEYPRGALTCIIERPSAMGAPRMLAVSVVYLFLDATWPGGWRGGGGGVRSRRSVTRRFRRRWCRLCAASNSADVRHLRVMLARGKVSVELRHHRIWYTRVAKVHVKTDIRRIRRPFRPWSDRVGNMSVWEPVVAHEVSFYLIFLSVHAPSLVLTGDESRVGCIESAWAVNSCPKMRFCRTAIGSAWKPVLSCKCRVIGGFTVVVRTWPYRNSFTSFIKLT